MRAGATGRTYTVQPGDQLKYVAAAYGVSLGELLASNHVPDPDHVAVGQVIVIPGPASEAAATPSPRDPGAPQPPEAGPAPVTYTVQRGDELRHIAAQYGVSMAAILAANHVSDPDSLTVGQVLTIPTASR